MTEPRAATRLAARVPGRGVARKGDVGRSGCR
jgi:hypothetical protein